MDAKRSVTAALAVCALVLQATVGLAATLAVDDDRAQDPNAPYTTIGAALAVAQPGDTILVFPGTYREQVVLTEDLSLFARSDLGPVIIRPTSLAASRPSLLKTNVLLTGAIIADTKFVAIDGFQLDLSGANVAACSPLLTGVYLRNASGTVSNLQIQHVRVASQPNCDTGIGIYAESGKSGENFGVPVFGRARLRLAGNTYTDYQKAGLVANGKKTSVDVRGDQALGSGSTAGAVQYGFQIGASAQARVAQFIARDLVSTQSGKAAAGVLLYRAHRAILTRGEVTNAQEGVLVVGDKSVTVSSKIGMSSADGIVFFGNRNVALHNTLNQAGDSGIFINGSRNRVHGGFMTDMRVGVWIYKGLLNRFGGIVFDNVPLSSQGVYGGSRSFDATAAAPVLTCSVDTDCNDGNSCTYDVCDTERGLCLQPPVPDGTVCGVGHCLGGQCQ